MLHGVNGGSSGKQIISQFAFNVFALIDVPILFHPTQLMDDRKQIDKIKTTTMTTTATTTTTMSSSNLSYKRRMPLKQWQELRVAHALQIHHLNSYTYLYPNYTWIQHYCRCFLSIALVTIYPHARYTSMRNWSNAKFKYWKSRTANKHNHNGIKVNKRITLRMATKYAMRWMKNARMTMENKYW